MEMNEVTTITAMVMSVLPVLWISYLYYRLQIHKLKIGAIEHFKTDENKKPVLLPKKE
jgi:hypothetical protein